MGESKKHTGRSPGHEKILLVICFCVTVLLAASLSAQNRPDQELSAKAMADIDLANTFFSQIDLSRVEHGRMRQYFENCQYDDSFDEFKNIFIENVKNIDAGDIPECWLWGFTTADGLLEGTVATEHFGERHLRTVYNIGTPGNMVWHKVPDSGYETVLRDIATMHWTNKLASAYVKTKSGKYLKAWQGYWADYSVNFMVSYKKCMADIKSGKLKLHSKKFETYIPWSVKSKLYFGWRAENFFKSLINIVKVDPELAKKTFDSRQLIEILNHFAEFEIPNAINRIKTIGVPNQFVLCTQGVMSAGIVMEQYNDSQKWLDASVERMKFYLSSGGYLRDGSDKEQSFNYNGLLIPTIDTLIRLLGSASDSEQYWRWLDELKEKRLYRSRFLATLRMPDGRVPSIGCTRNFDNMLEKKTLPDGKYTYPRKLWPTQIGIYDFEKESAADMSFKQGINENIWGKGKVSEPGFTSVYYPFGGFVVSRTGWKNDDFYSFMKTSRFGEGHARQGVNGLTVSAYGRYILVNSSDKSYLNVDTWSDYFKATVSQNSICVDGFSQVRGKFPKETIKYDEPINARWLSSESFDFYEGYYKDAYGKWNYKTNSHGGEDDYIKDVAHRRQVVFLREHGIWVVVDTVFSDSSHDYTLSWNFAPYFMNDEVLVDNNLKKVVTCKKSDVNTGLYFFGPGNMKLNKFFGAKNDKMTLGWVGAYRVDKEPPFPPAVDILAQWKAAGESMIITLIAPSADDKNRIKQLRPVSNNAFHAILDDGVEILFSASIEADHFEFEGYSAKSQIFVSVSDGKTEKGIVIDCNELGINNKNANFASKFFEYEFDGGEFERKNEIKVPALFEWAISNGNLVPVYDH